MDIKIESSYTAYKRNIYEGKVDNLEVLRPQIDEEIDNSEKISYKDE